MKTRLFLGLVTALLALGCDAPPLPTAGSAPESKAKPGATPSPASAESKSERAAADGPPQDGVTYFAIDSTPNSFVSRGVTGLTLAPSDGSQFGTAINQNGTLILSITPRDGDYWQLDLRAPNREPFAVQLYPDAVRADVSVDEKPWIWLASGSRGPNQTTGWFRVHEIQFAPGNKRIDRFSVDFLVIEHDGSRSFGRYRLRATVDPVPTAAEITENLRGADVVANERAGLEIVADQGLEYGLALFERTNGRKPASLEEFMKGVVEINGVRLPKLPADKEYWFDAKQGRLYIRPVKS